LKEKLTGLWGILSDIHGNWEALVAVCRDMDERDVRNKVCLGDIVGYGADSRRCLAFVKNSKWITIAGNHEEALVVPEIMESFSDLAVAGLLLADGQFGSEEREWMAKLPHVIRAEECEWVHATLDDPLSWDYILTKEDAKRHFLNQKAPVAFCGHTHNAMIWRKGRWLRRKNPSNRKWTLPGNEKILVNVGAVGQPRDGDPKASYVIYDPENRTIQFRRVAYDFKKTQRKIIQAGLPSLLAERLEHGR